MAGSEVAQHVPSGAGLECWFGAYFDHDFRFGVQVRRSAPTRTPNSEAIDVSSSLRVRLAKANALDEEPEDQHGFADEAEPGDLQRVAGHQHGSDFVDQVSEPSQDEQDAENSRRETRR